MSSIPRIWSLDVYFQDQDQGQQRREYNLKYQKLQKTKKMRIQKRKAVHEFYRKRGEVGEIYKKDLDG